MVLTLDASGSMGDTAFIDDSGVRYDRYQLATIAALTFLARRLQEMPLHCPFFSQESNSWIRKLSIAGFLLRIVTMTHWPMF